MAAPTIKFKRGSQANLPALAAGEPAFVNDEYNLYLGLDGTSGNNKFLGSARYWVKETATTGQAVKLYSRTDVSGGGSVSLASPDVTTDITFKLPSADGSTGHVLVTDGSGALSFQAPAASSFTLAADTGTSDTFNTGETLTFTGGEGIDTSVTNNEITITAELATETNAGVATFDGTDFTVTSGDVTLNTERIQDIVGDMVSPTNSEDGISVSYDDLNGKLDFDVADFTLTFEGDVTGTGTITNLANQSITMSMAANSVDLGTHTVGNYVEDVTAGAGLAKTSTAAEGQTVDLSIGAGTGITVNADDVQIKNAGSLTNDTVMGWDTTGGQLENAPITYSGTAVTTGGTLTTGGNTTIGGDLQVNGNDIKASDGTTAITLSSADVTIQGNLTVSGTTSTTNSTVTTYDDPVLELGTVSGAAPSSATTGDRGFRFHYYDTSAKTSSLFWDGNTGFIFVEDASEAVGPQLTGTLASVQVGGLWMGDFGTATNQVLNNNGGTFELINTLVDGGTF